MEILRAIFRGPNRQAELLRKCNNIIQSAFLKLDSDIAHIKILEAKIIRLTLQAEKHDDASRARTEARDFTRELIRTRRLSAQLQTSKRQLGSLERQINEVVTERGMEEGTVYHVSLTTNINALAKIPQLAKTISELAMELMKAGVFETDDGLELGGGLWEEEEIGEAEVDKVLGEILMS